MKDDYANDPWYMYHWALVFWALVLLLLFSPVIFADDLVYQSQTLAGTDTINDGPGTSSTSDSDAYIVDVNVSGPLPPNLNNAVITPNGWTVSCTRCLEHYMSSAPTIPAGMMATSTAVFMFSTDSTGKITSYAFSISGSYQVLDPSNPNGCCLSEGAGNFSSADSASSWQQLGHLVTQSLSAPPGTWTQSSLSNPPVTAPAPTQNVLARTCSSSWAAPTNSMGAGIAQTASGAGMFCGHPANYSPNWYIKVTTDGGKTYTFVTLKSLGLGN
jgi:hypothetical protein